MWLICCAWAAAGCQTLMTPAPPPTLTAVLLLADGLNRPRAETTRPVAAAAPTPPTRAVLPASPSPSPVVSPAPAPTPSRAPIMGMGGRPAFAVRNLPQADAPVVATLPGSQVVWAEGRSEDGRWLAVIYGEAADGLNRRGWVLRSDIALMGEAGDLPELAAARASGLNRTAAPAQSTPPQGGVAASAQPAAPGAAAGGKLVFQAAAGGDIYIVNVDGRGLRRLTDGIDPVLSPDGTLVAFARWGSPHGIFVLDLRTGQEQRIASVNRPRGPTWSADGARLAFTHVTRKRTCVDLGFSCVDVDEFRRSFGGRDCVETPQGRRCINDFPVVNIDDNGLALTPLRAGSASQSNLISEGTIQSAQWRPGQDQLLFRSRVGLQTIRPGEQPAPLGADPNIGSPAWSPDGQRLVAQMRIHNRTEIVLLDANGGVTAHLTQPPPTYERPGQPPPHNVAPAWSPDGRSILFLSDRSGAWKLYIMNADGSNQRLFLAEPLAAVQFRYDFAAERVVNWGK
jgi:dipeptidyl aminopeptidase/acylaminoacyl peptidase